MKKYQYIIIGGGMTGSAAVMGIRNNDPGGSIALFTEEKYSPYNRPPLTKGLWNGMQIEDIVRPIDKYHIDLYLEAPIIDLNPGEKVVLTAQGERYQYKKLLLATGGRPNRLRDAPEGVIYYRTREDYHTVKALSESKSEFCVIGGGFIGSEIATALTKYGSQVTMIFPEIGISGLMFPDDLSIFLNQFFQEKGVNVISRNLVDSIEEKDDTYIVRYRSVDTGETSQKKFNSVIVGIGIKPNLDLAEKAGIEVDNGIVVNDYLQTNQPDIFAAGDVAFFNHKGLKKQLRLEHEDNANQMGLAVGLNMSGEMEKYDHFPFFYSDLFDLGYEAIGEMNKEHEIYEDWIEPYKKGTVFYLKNEKIRGLIFWNLWGKIDQGRDIIRSGSTYKSSELPGLFTDD